MCPKGQSDVPNMAGLSNALPNVITYQTYSNIALPAYPSGQMAPMIYQHPTPTQYAPSNMMNYQQTTMPYNIQHPPPNQGQYVSNTPQAHSAAQPRIYASNQHYQGQEFYTQQQALGAPYYSQQAYDSPAAHIYPFGQNPTQYPTQYRHRGELAAENQAQSQGGGFSGAVPAIVSSGNLGRASGIGTYSRNRIHRIGCFEGK